ncbi:MAG: CAP domain-containing protein [Kangiella sp.]|nr:CAP domain-containing protein [Kangiella sp.]
MLRISLFILLVLSYQLEAKEGSYESCGLNHKARELARLIITNKDQKRPILQCNALLAEVAYKKAKEMAKEGKVSHNGPGGMPDQRLIDAGYPLSLPASVVGTNHVESVMGGATHAEEVLDYFANSYAHRIHIFGEHPFYLEQFEIGIGYTEEWHSPHIDYWVVYIAKAGRLTIEYGDRDPLKETKYLGVYKK